MANANRPAGLSPVGYLGAADWDGRGNVYYVPSTSTNALFIGDPVALSGTADAAGIASVDLGSAGSTIVGAIIGIGTSPNGPFIDFNDLSKVSAPATKTQAYYVLVADDPNTIFEIQEIGTGTPLTAAEVSLNANFVYVAPATGVRVSAVQLDNATEQTTSTLNLKILGLVRRADNAFGQYAKYRVLINNHSFRTGITGA